MRKTTKSISTLALFLCVSLVQIMSSGCTNRRYPDLMRVTAECDEAIEQQMTVYNGGGLVSQRISARERIVALRRKQMIMAQRIDVKTMTEVVAQSMTYEQGEAKKADLVRIATGRYEEALKMPMPSSEPAMPALK